MHPTILPHILPFLFPTTSPKITIFYFFGLNLDTSGAYKIFIGREEYCFDEFFAHVDVSLMQHVNHGLLLQPVPIQVEFASKMADDRTCLWQLEVTIAKTRKHFKSLQHNG